MAAKIASLEAQIATLKAEAANAEDETTAEEAAPPEAEADVEMEYAGDMSVEDFKALIAEAVKAALGSVSTEMKALTTKLNMAEKMGAMMEEMKGYFGGQTQKDDSKAQQIADLEARMKTLSRQLSELLGDQPAAVASASDGNVVAVETPGKLDVQTNKGGRPAYRHPADQIGAWIEGQTS